VANADRTSPLAVLENAITPADTSSIARPRPELPRLLDPLLLRVVVGGAVFASEGLQKLLYPLDLGSGRFEKIGLPLAHVLGPAVGITEVVCGLLVVFGVRLRLVTLPLIGIMLGALLTTKLPILLGHDVFGLAVRALPRYGLLAMLHEARTDLLALSALALLWVRARGDG
jgi:uncharacterized membrane protein YphA (DoxX/SURF4 family)